MRSDNAQGPKSQGNTGACNPGDTLSNSDGTQVTLQWRADTLHALCADPTISDWLKGAIVDLARRDPLDALHDIERLLTLMQDRHAACLRVGYAAEPQDSESR